MGTSHHVDLFLVRHGITEWNEQKRYLGHTDQGLVRKELSKLDRLKSELQKKRFDYVFTSDLQRCIDTFHYMQIPIKAIVDHRLREMNFGDWEGKTYSELKDLKAYQNWLDNWEVASVPNGEYASLFKTRIDSFFHELFQRVNDLNGSQKILLITHGGVIRYVVSKFTASTTFWDVSITHGQALQLKFEKKEGEWKCSSFSEVLSQEKEK
ncbi:histidine phosphatase family protein [Bacillus sp. UMB0899]|uniref:histidine phosphatase family protein n=1 Tax=Metabacillus schmidteae TaxID=2730405 RepID=UPI000C80709E|nr:histidine phosphatase family protein [Metabacillus schmidteae]PMC35967.1 histidine phosphatase family protein [Bacillus sp. UMB0899]